MSARAHATAAAGSAPRLPTRARALAARLAGLFEADQQIVGRLNEARHRLAAANDRLRRDPVGDPLDVHHEVHSAFWAYEQASEQRRQLAVDVGELAQQLTGVLTAAGHSPEQARSANVHEIAAGTWHPTNAQDTRQQ